LFRTTLLALILVLSQSPAALAAAHVWEKQEL